MQKDCLGAPDNTLTKVPLKFVVEGIEYAICDVFKSGCKVNRIVSLRSVISIKL